MQTVILFSEAYIIGFSCGVIGAVYRYVLAYERILSWWFRFGNRYENKWFFKPVWDCAKCFSGQLAGWVWLLTQVVPAIMRHTRQKTNFFDFWTNTTPGAGAMWLGHLTAISVAIVSAIVAGHYLKEKN